MLTDNDLKSYIGSYYQGRKITYTKLDKHDRAIGVLLEENKKLHSIIKEVREYIDYYGISPEQNDDVMVRHILKGIVKILDKVGKENDIEFDILKALNTDLDDDVEMG